MGQDHLTGDGEAQTGAAVVAAASIVETGEPVEDAPPIRRRDAGPVVADDENYSVPVGT